MERPDVGFAPQEPEQFVDDGLEMQLLGGQHGEAGRQVESHLVAEDAERAGPGPVGLGPSLLEDVVHQVAVLAHGRGPLSSQP
jgi:hypothetical protein